MTVVVRAADSVDHEAAIAVWAASDAARRQGPPAPGVADKLRDRFTQADVWLLVADDDGVVVGVTQGGPAREDEGTGPVIPGRCHLSLVFVAPDRWGEGIGGRLVDAALDQARSTGYSRMQLYTHESNRRAQALYTSRGFRHDGLVKDDDFGERIGRWSRAI
jgi:GNAT superfamily N-acetyltransferase